METRRRDGCGSGATICDSGTRVLFVEFLKNPSVFVAGRAVSGLESAKPVPDVGPVFADECSNS